MNAGPREITDVNTCFGVYPRRRVDYSLRTLNRLMDENGVKKALTLSLKGVLYDHAEGNAETLAACASNERLIAAATLDPRKYSGEGEVVRGLRRAGFEALKLFPDLQGWPIRYAPFRAILRALQDENMPLFISAPGYGMATDISDLVGGYSFPVVISGVGYWTLSEAIAIMRGQESVFLETSHLDSPDAFEVLVREVGSDRLLFGSNAPITYFRGPYLALARSDVSEKDKDAIFHNNAEKLLGGGHR